MPTFEIAKLELKPGDVLLVRVDEGYSGDDIVALSRVLDGAIPPRVKYIICPKNVDFQKVTLDHANV